MSEQVKRINASYMTQILSTTQNKYCWCTHEYISVCLNLAQNASLKSCVEKFESKEVMASTNLLNVLLS